MWVFWLCVHSHLGLGCGLTRLALSKCPTTIEVGSRQSIPFSVARTCGGVYKDANLGSKSSDDG
jgi:hypothetical protein